MRTALVTGSTRNIGRAIAERMAADGAAVIVNGRDQAAADEVAAELVAADGTAIGWACDVSDSEAVRQMVEGATAQLGTIDILVNNAVSRHHGSVSDTATEDWRATLAIILDAAFHCTQAVLPGMRAARWGRILNIAGVSGQKGAANRAAVVTGKSGLIGFTKAVALETAGEGITVNAVSPGLIATRRDIPPEQRETAMAHYNQETAKIPLGRQGNVSEVAGACAYLCSEDAAFVTGQVLSVNGGLYT